MKEVNTNNSKKLIIGISIFFCTIILIIGATTAYFTQSDSESTGNIVSVEQVTLEYKDDYNENTIYNRQGLIPSSYDNVITAYNREGDKKCLDEYDYSACSIYRFSVKNNSEVSQLIQMSLHPTANSYTNLKFIMFELNGESKSEVMTTTDLIKGNYEGIPLLGSYTLNPNNTKIYEIVFYIENLDSDQTSDDAGKTFGAGIKINSITTGKYITKQYSATCWTPTLIPTGEENEGTYRLDVFNGLNADGSVKEECTGYIEQDTDTYYKVFIPSEVGGKHITTIGNDLLNARDFDGNLTNYIYIKNIIIDEGILTIQDGDPNSFAFGDIGVNDNRERLFHLEVKLPNSLKKIGRGAFAYSSIQKLDFPAGLEEIGPYAFEGCDLTYSIEEPLIIPASVNYIGGSAFSSFRGNQNLLGIRYNGTNEDILNNTTGWYDPEVTTLNPQG